LPGRSTARARTGGTARAALTDVCCLCLALRRVSCSGRLGELFHSSAPLAKKDRAEARSKRASA